MRRRPPPTTASTLYLTYPDALWALTHDRAKPTHEAPPPSPASDLAVHVPCVPSWSDARTHDVWRVWSAADPHVCEAAEPVLPVRTKTARAYASVLDAYLKTVAPAQDTSAPLHVPHASNRIAPSALLHKGFALLRKTQSSSSTALSSSPRVHASDAPLAVLDNAKRRRLHVRLTQRVTRTSTTTSSTAALSAPASKAVPRVVADVLPRRVQWAPVVHATKKVVQRPVVSNPYTIAACTCERAEQHVLHTLSSATHPRASSAKPPLKALVHLVRRLVQRGAVIDDWLDTCEVGSDLLEVAPVPFKKNNDASLLTPTRLRSVFRKHVDVLVQHHAPHAREVVLQLAIALLPTMREGWWWSSSTMSTSTTYDALNAAADKLPPLHHAAAVKAYVHKLPQPLADVLRQYIHVQQLKGATFRKDAELAAWTLARNAHRTVQQAQLQQQAHQPQQSGGGAMARATPAFRVRQLRLSTADRVPQHVQVAQKKSTRTASPSLQQPSSSTYRTFVMPPCRTRPLTPKATKASSNSKSTTNATNATASAKAGANKTSGGGDSSSNTTNNTSNTTTSTSNTTTNTSTNTTTTTSARALTPSEIDAYRQGLKAHIKAKGGTPFLKAQQEQQNKRVPAFDFTALVPKSHPCHTSLQKKLKLSAKNRNALRKIKRKVLRAYGGLRTFRKSNNAAASQTGGASHPYGSLYTKKNVGGSRSDDAANAPYVCGSQMPTRQDANVTWENKDSLGASLRDTSQMDLNTTAGTSDIDLGSLEVVDVA